MLKSYLTIAWRTIRNNKVFSAINILGLALGIACTMLIIFHVGEELSYEKHYSKADRIFRVTLQEKGENARHWAATAPPLGPMMQDAIPEIQRMVRFQKWVGGQLLSYTDAGGKVKRFEEKGGFFADSTAIEVFDLAFASGDPASALKETNSIIITRAMANKYFGTGDAMGKIIQEDVGKQSYKVTGILKDRSFPTHLDFDYLVSMPTIRHYQNEQSLSNRTWSGFYTYVLLHDAAAKAKVEAKIPAFMLTYYSEPPQEILSSRLLQLQPITDIHLHSKLEKEIAPNGDIAYVYIFSIAAVFILLIAAVNFINISTAQAFNRMKEIGLRKVVGATKPQLIKQFLGESLLTTLLATAVALVLFRAAIPFYNGITGNEVTVGQLLTFSNLGWLLLLVAGIGLLSGLYPAWFVARFNPITSIKGRKLTTSSVNLVRKGLIVFQFVISVFLIFSTMIIYRQMKFFHNKDLGFDKEQVMAITMYGDDMWRKFGTLVNKMQQNSAIKSYATASRLPGDRFGMEPFVPVGIPDDAQIPGTRVMWADEKFLPTMQIALKEGRNFFNQFPRIKQQEFIVNETAAKALQLQYGSKVALNNDTGMVVGVIKDFNFASLHSPVDPLVIQYGPFRTNYLLVKIQAGKIPETIRFMESSINALSPSSAFTYTFIDDKLNQLYKAENRMSTIFKVFAGFAIFISCLGLFGLSAYAAQLRTKEVGIRKVLGASTGNVVIMLSRSFVQLVLVATVISWPLAWFTMSRWLEAFAYRIDIGVWVFVFSGALALFVAILTVSTQAIKAALLNPVKSLRSE
jgi:putative ABC transport system permease protein